MLSGLDVFLECILYLYTHRWAWYRFYRVEPMTRGRLHPIVKIIRLPLNSADGKMSQWVHRRTAKVALQIERIDFWDQNVKYVRFGTRRRENINLQIFIDVVGIFSIIEKVFNWEKSDEDSSWNMSKDLLTVRWIIWVNHLKLVMKSSFFENLIKMELN